MIAAGSESARHRAATGSTWTHRAMAAGDSARRLARTGSRRPRSGRGTADGRRWAERWIRWTTIGCAALLAHAHARGTARAARLGCRGIIRSALVLTHFEHGYVI